MGPASTIAPPRDPSPKVLFATVGLPARGKSYLARKITRYLNWLGYAARVFNVGSERRAQLGERKDHDFFDPNNVAALAVRYELANQVLDSATAWLHDGGDVAVFDATNTTGERRRLLVQRADREGFRLVFIEVICETPAIIEEAIRATKLHSPDYAGIDPEEAARDFRMRIAHYRRAYEPLEDELLHWVRLVENHQLVINRVDGDIESKVVRLLMALLPRKTPKLWLSRHGESLSNVDGKVGGDTRLSERGHIYADRMVAHLKDVAAPPERVWCSSLVRTQQTAERLDLPVRVWRALDEIDAGVCDGLTYADIQRQFPGESEARALDKLSYRYPRGESYLDLIARIEPVVLELEQARSPVLIIGHRAALRVLYGYLIGEPAASLPHLDLQLHTLIELIPTPQGYDEARHQLGPAPATNV